MVPNGCQEEGCEEEGHEEEGREEEEVVTGIMDLARPEGRVGSRRPPLTLLFSCAQDQAVGLRVVADYPWNIAALLPAPSEFDPPSCRAVRGVPARAAGIPSIAFHLPRECQSSAGSSRGL